VKLRSGTRIVWAPLAHIGGLWGVLQSLVEGRRISLMERFEVEGWVARLGRHRPAVTGLPPAGLRMLLDAGIDPARLSSLRAVTTGTAATPADLVEEFESRFGIPVLATYGATEFAGAIASWTLADHQRFGMAKRGSVGRPHPGVEVRIGDGHVLEARGAQLGPEWVRTSDLAHIDDDGFLYIDGRADDVIVRGGFKVSTSAVVKVLEQHPLVTAAAVVGVPDRRLGEVPVAAVETAGGATAAAIEAFLRERLAPYQVPAAIHLVDRIPRTPSLKVDAVAVREMVGVSG
jgi:acyl-CoA synthetase (AMP-forming)/AMP-acid ligase II